MGTRWQHVPVLKELSKIHALVPVTPGLLTQLLPGELALLTVDRSAPSGPLVQEGTAISCLLLGGAMEVFQLLSDRL